MKAMPSGWKGVEGHSYDNPDVSTPALREVIYAAFAWSKAEVAYDAVVAIAAKHGVGSRRARSCVARP
jgi:hypothetical protein